LSVTFREKGVHGAYVHRHHQHYAVITAIGAWAVSTYCRSTWAGTTARRTSSSPGTPAASGCTSTRSAYAFSQPYVEISHVGSSTPSTTNELAVLAGTSCGIAREGEWASWYDTTHQLETCVTARDLPTKEEMADEVAWETTTTGMRDEDGLAGGGAPILDQELPLP
jgi:hypothetical protein